MITIAETRELALSLPETQEHDHRGRPSFRVWNSIFATLWEAEKRAMLKASWEEQDLMTTDFPDTFSVGPWASQGWMFVELQTVEKELFHELLVSAWRRVAPESVVAEFESDN